MIKGPHILQSSHIGSISFDTSDSALIVTFKDGSVYSYANVPEHLFLGLMSAKSAGKYLAEHVKGKYESRALNPKK
jgi:hypothetical protein